MISRWIFLRLIGAIFGVAFFSLWVQLDGLISSHGILPIQDFLQAAERQLGPAAWRVLPTLCWLNSSDGFLHALCATGVIASLLAMCGIAQAAALGAAWLCYLSLQIAGQSFLSFQWDVLLLETGFLAVFFAPLSLRPAVGPAATPSSLVIHWALLWLLFRLMFASGAIKLFSEDPTWRNLTALAVHYETQPLPIWAGWFMHQLPAWFHKLSCVIMFIIELLIPFLIFTTRRLRRIAFFMLMGFQALIAVTGNYCFFNLLTMALCLLLLDDLDWPRIIRVAIPTATRNGRAAPNWPLAIIGPVGALILLLSVVQFTGFLRTGFPWPAPVRSLYQSLSAIRIVNGYGLFAVMTTSRPEIIVEGSLDRITWKTYTFKYKPGDLKRRPALVAPHQPRLDWQMWFAALGNARENPWFMNFCARLLQGEPAVLRLLQDNPFPGQPPKFLRATTYTYQFTGFAAWRRDGTWWRRTRQGPYTPVLSFTR